MNATFPCEFTTVILALPVWEDINCTLPVDGLGATTSSFKEDAALVIAVACCKGQPCILLVSLHTPKALSILAMVKPAGKLGRQVIWLFVAYNEVRSAGSVGRHSILLILHARAVKEAGNVGRLVSLFSEQYSSTNEGGKAGRLVM